LPQGAFDHCASDYARHRPTYPTGVFEALERLIGPPAGRRVADVGAGTGIFSRALAGRGWRVVAVEPSPQMLRHVFGDGSVVPPGSADPTRAGRDRAWPRERGPCHPPPALVPIFPVCASAEATGLADGAVVMATAAQAFHWFNPPYALAEFARIVQPGGVLALIWNNRDAARSPFVEDYERLIARHNPAYQREYRQQDWPAKIAACGAFEPARYECFQHVWTLPPDGLVGFSRSVSYIRNVLPREQQPLFEADLRELIRRHFGHGDCVLPMRTDLWTARRR